MVTTVLSGMRFSDLVRAMLGRDRPTLPSPEIPPGLSLCRSEALIGAGVGFGVRLRGGIRGCVHRAPPCARPVPPSRATTAVSVIASSGVRSALLCGQLWAPNRG